MKIVFGPQDNVFEMFKTISKIPSKKKVYILIRDENPIYQNEFWGKQLIEQLDKQQLHYKIIAKSLSSKKYFLALTPHVLYEFSFFEKAFTRVYEFFLQARDAHSEMVSRRNWGFYGILLVELIAMGLLIKFFYDIVSPSATIYITPYYREETFAYNVELFDASRTQQTARLGVGYRTKSITATIQSQVYPQNLPQADGKIEVEIVNSTSTDYSLKPTTKFIDTTGRLFQITSWLYIPSSGKTKVILSPLSVNVNGGVQNMEGVAVGQQVYIKNLPVSNIEKKIVGTITTYKKTSDQKVAISASDIEQLKTKLREAAHKEKYSLIRQQQSDILIPFDKLFTVTVLSYDVPEVGTPANVVPGSATVQITYPYITEDDFQKYIKKWVSERIASNQIFLKVDNPSIVFYTDPTSVVNLTNSIILVPVKFDVVLGYDFGKDLNNTKDEIKTKIRAKKIEEAKSIISSYSDIASSSITVYPTWYDSIPTIKSKISIVVSQK